MPMEKFETLGLLIPGGRREREVSSLMGIYAKSVRCSSIEVDLGQSLLNKSNFDHATLAKTNLRRARMIRASFVDADLGEADLSEADLTKSNFSGANLEGAILSNAKLDNITLMGARLFRVDLKGAKGLDSVSAEWIDIGEKEEPVILTGDEIQAWLVSTSKGNRKRIHTYSDVKMQAA